MLTKSREVCIKARSTPASLPFKGQATEQTTVKWSIPKVISFKLFLDMEPISRVDVTTPVAWMLMWRMWGITSYHLVAFILS